MTGTAPRRYDRFAIDYASMGEQDLLGTLLQIGQREGLWRHEATTTDGFYVLSAGGRRYQIAAAEVPGVVIGYAMATGRDLGPLAYRQGLEPVDTPTAPGSVERAPGER